MPLPKPLVSVLVLYPTFILNIVHHFPSLLVVIHRSFQTTYPTSYTFQLCQGDQWPPREPPSLTVVDIVTDTLPSIHNTHSISSPVPSHSLYQYLAPLHQHPSLTFSLKRRCSSLPPTFKLHTPSPHLGTCQPHLDMQDEHMASPLLDIHTIDDEQTMSIWGRGS